MSALSHLSMYEPIKRYCTCRLDYNVCIRSFVHVGCTYKKGWARIGWITMYALHHLSTNVPIKTVVHVYARLPCMVMCKQG